MRYFMTTIISKLQFGFSLDLGQSLPILTMKMYFSGVLIESK